MSATPLPQYEDPDGVSAIAIWKARQPNELRQGARMSGAVILNFQKGWAHSILANSDVAHWFVRSGDFCRSLCSFDVFSSSMYGAGTYPRCGRCIKVMTRMIRGGLM